MFLTIGFGPNFSCLKKIKINLAKLINKRTFVARDLETGLRSYRLSRSLQIGFCTFRGLCFLFKDFIIVCSVKFLLWLFSNNLSIFKSYFSVGKLKTNTIMNDNFKNIIDSLIKNGFIESEENVKDLGRKLDFKITQYSLNTDLSFKFLNSDDFVNFLNYSSSEEITKEKIGLINAAILEQGLNPDDFFYVNFYKKEVNEL